jgi:hypothetical protein
MSIDSGISMARRPRIKTMLIDECGLVVTVCS